MTFGGLATGITYGAATLGRYTKIGRTVIATGAVALTSKGSATGPGQIVGLPFTSVNDTLLNACTIGFASGMSSVVGAVLGLVQANGNKINTYQSNNGGAAALTNANYTNSSTIYLHRRLRHRYSGAFLAPPKRLRLPGQKILDPEVPHDHRPHRSAKTRQTRRSRHPCRPRSAAGAGSLHDRAGRRAAAGPADRRTRLQGRRRSRHHHVHRRGNDAGALSPRRRRQLRQRPGLAL